SPSTSLSLSSSTFIEVQRGASFTVGPAVSIYSAIDSDSSERRVATLRVREGALMLFEGSGHATSSLFIDVVVEGAVVLNNTNSDLFSVALRGFTSTPATSITLSSSSSSLLLGCPP